MVLGEQDLPWGDRPELEPRAVLKAVRDDQGVVRDFVYIEVNDLACREHRRSREDLHHRSVVQTVPEVERSGLLAAYADCLNSGQPLLLVELAYRGTTPPAVGDSATPHTRRYEVEVTPLPDDCISLRWRDVTDRVDALAAAEQALSDSRACIAQMTEPLAILEAVRDSIEQTVDLVFRNVNRACCECLGMAEADLVNHTASSIFSNAHEAGLIGTTVRWAEAGEVFEIDDLVLASEEQGRQHRYQVRGTQIRPGLVSITFEDTTDARRTANTLAEAEDRYRLLAENSAHVVAHVGVSGLIKWVSPSVEWAFGAAPSHWIGLPATEVIAPLDAAGWMAMESRALQGGKAFGRVRTQDSQGAAHWTEVHVQPFSTSDGTPDGYVSFIRPIDEQVALERQRDAARTRQAEVEAHYRRLIESSCVATALVDVEGKFQFVNPAMCELFGYDAEVLLTMSWTDISNPADHGMGYAALAELLSGRIDTHRGHYRFPTRRSESREMWIDLSVSLVRDGDGEPEYLVAQHIDITEQVEARERLEAVTGAMLDPQVLLEAVRDSAGRVVDFVYRIANDAACDYLRLSREELVGALQSGIQPQLRTSGIHDRFLSCLETGDPVVLDDFPFPEMLAGTRRYDLRAARATADTLSVTWRDVTDRVEQRQAIERAHELLRASSDAMLSPQSVVEVTQDTDGTVVDAVFRDANRAFCEYTGMTREQLVGHRVLDLFPAAARAGLMAHYERCALDGEPVILDDFPYVDEEQGLDLRYDIRGAQVRPGLIVLTFRDTSRRFAAARRLAESEERYRLLALNATDAVAHLRGGIVVWFSPVVEEVLGAPPKHWIGTRIRDVVAAEDIPVFDECWAKLRAGEECRQRIRVVSVDGMTHWVHVHARAFYDAEGRPDGVSAALRLIDDEVAAETELAEARSRQARADALYRRSMESTAVAMSLAGPDGAFCEVNEAMCEFFGYEAEALLTKNWIDLIAPEGLDLNPLEQMLAGRIDSYRLKEQKFLRSDGRTAWGDLYVACLRDPGGSVSILVGQIIDVTDEVRSRQQLAASEESYRLIAENIADVVIHSRGGRIAWVSPSIEGLLGAPASYWMGRELIEVLPPEEREAGERGIAALEAGQGYQRRIQVRSVDGTLRWVHVNAQPFYDTNGNQSGVIALWRPIDEEVRAEAEAAEARRREARAEALYRRSVESAAVGMCQRGPEGRFLEVNEALCNFFGYDAETLMHKTWQDLTAPDFVGNGLDREDEILAGRLESYRALKKYLHADGHQIWGDLSVSCTRDAEGRVERFIAQIIDVTETVEANARSVELARRLREDLESAARYMASIMPGELTGAVTVSSRYVPSQELGGDCFDYTWVDDDHLVMYLLDVSGHGIEAALLAVSLQNLLRSGTFSAKTLRDPSAVLSRLNRMFPTEQQADHFFTMWYGVYEKSTRTLRYASAGTPPAYAFHASSQGQITTVPLLTESPPVGVVAGIEFPTTSHSVPQGCRVLIFSDGADELPLAGGGRLSLQQFESLAARVAGSPGYSLDDLLNELRKLTPDGEFDDDVSLIQLTLD